MKNKYHETLVVGNGPTANFFISKALQKNMKIAQVSSFSENQNNLPYINFTDKKKLFWKFLPKNNNESKIIKKQNFFSFFTFENGGLASRWGGGISKLKRKDIKVSKKVYQKIFSYYHEIEKKIGSFQLKSDKLDNILGKFKKADLNEIQNKNTFFFRDDKYTQHGFSRKAIALEKIGERLPCNNCGGCNIHCFNKSFFNGKVFHDTNKKYLNVYEKYKLKKIRKSSNNTDYLVTISNGNNDIEIEVKNLILAMGTLSTTYYTLDYLKSLNIFVYPKLKHNILYRGVFLSLRKKINIIGPSGTNVSITKINDHLNAYSSYTHGNSIPTSDLLSLLFIKGRFFRHLIDHFKNYILVSLTFFPSEYSNHFTFKDNNPSLLKNNNNFIYKISVIFKIIYNLFRSGFLPIIMQKMVDGSDLHYGSTFPIGKKNNINVNDYCELNNHKNLYLIDGSWLPRVSEKPHTFTLMANAMRIADLLCSKKTNP